MATCKQSGAELIQDIFSPCVAVICSSDVEAICAKNNLTFVEMVQPFCHLNAEVTIRDPSNVACSVRNLKINMKEMNSVPPPLNIGKKVMHDAVANTASEGVLCNSIKDDIYEIKYSASTPWFEAYREVFFQVVAPTEHEFMQHYLSCIFVVSSSHPDPLSQIHQLCQEQQQCHLQNSQQNNNRWFFTHIFKYYVLLHDTSSDSLAKAEAVFQSMKSSFGAPVCHLLQINSSSIKNEVNAVNSHEEMNGAENIPDPWSRFFSKFCPQQETAATTNEAIEDGQLPNHVGGDDAEPQTLTKEDLSANGKSTIPHPLLNSTEDLSITSNSVSETPKDGTKSSVVNSDWGKSSNRNKKHGLCLTLSDMDRIRVFVQDFCIQGLAPFVEKQIRILSDQVTNRKSIHRTIFGVTKKLFAGNKPGVQGPIASANSVVYGQDAPELQVRKLGDLAFMFQLYEVAYQAYHTAKRDFSGEAWLHFAGACEMAALSVFMQKTSLHEYPARYMETAITTYLYTCKLPELAIRATLLSTECLKAKGLYKDAAFQFNRILTEADLPSALLLEQAAHCSINCKPPYIRKYMFNLILAGHRFSKCGQRKHTLRAYKQVEQAYDQLGWNAAKNHIKSLTGRTSVQLKQVESAYNAFHQLLSAQREQPSIDQSNCFRDFLSTLKEYLSQQASQGKSHPIPFLPVPLIDNQATKVLLGEESIVCEDGSFILKGRGFQRGDLNNEVWAKLEEMMIVAFQKNLPPLHSPQIYCFTDTTNNVNKPTCAANETITVELILKNPLSISFAIDNVYLLWEFEGCPDVNSNTDISTFSNELHSRKPDVWAELNSVVETQVINQVMFDPLQERKLHLCLKPLVAGSLVVKGLSYSLQGPFTACTISESDVLNAFLQGKQLVELKGPRLNRTAAERATKSYAVDNRLNLQVVSSMPKLQVKYKSFPSSLFCGEIYQTVVELSNVGDQALQRIAVTSPTPSVFVLGLVGQLHDSMLVYKEVPCSRNIVPSVMEWDNCDWKFEVRDSKGDLCRLVPGESISLPVWFRGPDLPGNYNVDLLFYYETDSSNPKLRHRLLQQSSVLNVRPSLNLHAKATSSQQYEDTQQARSSGSSSLLVSVVVGNHSEELQEINVIQVSCVSPLWYLSSREEQVPKGISVIVCKECFLISLKASNFHSDKPESSQKAMVLSHVPLGLSEVDCTASPCADFISRSRIGPEFLSLTDCREAEYTEFLSSHNMILLLTVIWKAKFHKDGITQIITGQHHVKIDNVITSAISSLIPISKGIAPPQPEISPSSPTADQLVQCFLTHEFVVQNDFNQKKLVIVPVDFIVQSTSSVPLKIILDNSESNASSHLSGSPEGSHVPMSQLFTWCKGSKRIIDLEPRATVSVSMQALFCHPGTYNLGCLNVKVSRTGEAVVPYTMSPYLIVISASDAPIH